MALPGPPREMRPMWAGEALPRLGAIGLGADVASTTFRLADIGESQVAEILGEAMLRRSNPQIATYARAEAVDVRVSAIGGPTTTARSGPPPSTWRSRLTWSGNGSRGSSGRRANRPGRTPSGSVSKRGIGPLA
ncbi:MAG: hypothetical protein WKF78_13345 [Candidatus Limnocylindrales bacterium]